MTTFHHNYAWYLLEAFNILSFGFILIHVIRHLDNKSSEQLTPLERLIVLPLDKAQSDTGNLHGLISIAKTVNLLKIAKECFTE